MQKGMAISVPWIMVLLSLVKPLPSVAQVGRDLFPRIYIIDRDGANLRLLDDAQVADKKWCGSVSWSHDGKKIAFDATPDNRRWSESRIAVYVLAGQQQGSTIDLGYGNTPTWSPDDSHLAFFLNQGTPNGERAGVWVMNADGTGREWLCPGVYPMWSPDGRYISCEVNFQQFHHYRLFEVATGRHTILGDSPIVGIDHAAWSPDGRQLAIIAPRLLKERVIEICEVANPNESRRVVWRPHPDHDLPPDAEPEEIIWSPTGKEFLVRFTKIDYTQSPFYLIPIEGDGRPQSVPLNDWHGRKEGPWWSPDGKQFVFTGDRR